MAESVEELNITFEEEGVEVVKQLDKFVLSKGAWVTMMFLYQEFDKKENDYGEPKVSIRRYQKRNDQYFQKSKFNISSKKQAMQIIDVLKQWYPEADEK